jgi:transposase-like protein
MEISDPTSIRKLITPDIPLGQTSKELKWIVFILNLYFWGVPLSRLGEWMNVHKTTILRWIMGLVLQLWPLITEWIKNNIKARICYCDEKWIKIRGKWHYWFVVLDAKTQIPITCSLLPRLSKWSCRWIGIKLKLLGKLPSVIVTDGLAGYKKMLPEVKHQLCIFHHQQGVTRWLKENFSDEKKIKKLKRKMKKVFQTSDKRTVIRRFKKLSKKAKKLGITSWIEKTRRNLPNLLPAVGSKRIPTTNNCIERFFGRFNRFYKVRRGFHSVRSCKRELILFMVVYLFSKREDGTAPLSSIVPNLSSMPLFKLINDPFQTVLGIENVNKSNFFAKNQQMGPLIE